MNRKTTAFTQARAPLALALASALGMAVVPGLAQAVTYTVTSNGDAGTGTCGTTCTLRDAIAAATSGSDIVMIPSTLSGNTITLNISGKGHIAINHSLTIQGPGANLLTVSSDGAATSKGGIFYISGSYYSLTVSGMTLANGNATGYGGALAVLGFQNNVTLDHVALVNNHAKGGGGFYAGRETVTVNHSTISGNSASSFGGGFDSNYATVALTDCTVTGNSAGSVGSGAGGGFYIRGPLTVKNSTISGNNAQSGSGFEVNVYSSSVTNSIISANSNPNQQFLSTGQGRTPTLTVSYSLINGSYFVGGGATFSGSHLITGQDPMLGSLAANGGPTQTLALLPGSPAIDAGSNGTISPCETTDQRDVTRPQGIRCDMGAVEMSQYALTVTVSGSGSVSASPTPQSGAITSCTGSCTADFLGEGAGTPITVTLTATGNNVTWGGDCAAAGSNPTATVTMSAARSCTAMVTLPVTLQSFGVD